MWCGVVTLFPEMFQILREGGGVTSRAIKRGLLELKCYNPRDFTTLPHRTVDDRPYGGGPGMVLAVQPLQAAVEHARREHPEIQVIYLSPQGKRVQQQDIEALRNVPATLLVAGRYEGVDERFVDLEVDQEWSIGDYVLSGGELPAMVIIDSLARLLPGVLGNDASVTTESFAKGLLDCPHYTRPAVYQECVVPQVLIEGNHQMIEDWRLKQQLGRTWLRRPDLLTARSLNKKEQQLLNEFIEEWNQKGEANE